MWRLLRDVGLDRATEVITWNVVPWYVGTGTKVRPVNRADMAEARPAVHVSPLLPRLRVVVLLGKNAAKAWRYLGSDLPTIECPHPSPLSVNRYPWVRDRIRDALTEARRAASRAS